jgi:hypothetical protein
MKSGFILELSSVAGESYVIRALCHTETMGFACRISAGLQSACAYISGVSEDFSRLNELQAARMGRTIASDPSPNVTR